MIAPRCVVAVLPRREPCPEPPASPAGFCAGHLRQAAAELARLTPRAGDPDDPRPDSVPFRDLCARCGRPGHDAGSCDA